MGEDSARRGVCHVEDDVLVGADCDVFVHVYGVYELAGVEECEVIVEKWVVRGWW